MGRSTRGSASASTSRWRASRARTETPGLTGRDYAYNVDSEYDDGKHRAGFEYGRTGEDFNPEVGFLENEVGYRRMFFRFQETMRQEKIRDWGFREWLPHVQLHALRLPRWRTEHRGAASSTTTGTGRTATASTPRCRARGKGSASRSRSIPASSSRPASTAVCVFRMNSNTDRRKWVFGATAMGRGHVPDRHAEQPARCR